MRSALCCFVKDRLGSVRTVVDAPGDKVKEARDYYPFGLRMPGRSVTAGTPAREDFTGYERDAETGLHYAGARYYMSAYGRWMATDPLLQGNPAQLLKNKPRLLTVSPYDYVLGNPVALHDPDGRCPIFGLGGSCGPSDWYRDRDGEYRHDEAVKSQADLEEGQTYLGERVLVKDGDNTEFLSADGSRGFVFDDGQAGLEQAATATAGMSVGKEVQGRALQQVLKSSAVHLGFFLDRIEVLVDGVDWPSAHVAVAQMRPLGVVVSQPLVEIGL